MSELSAARAAAEQRADFKRAGEVLKALGSRYTQRVFQADRSPGSQPASFLERFAQKYPGENQPFGADSRGQILLGAAQALSRFGFRECSVEQILEASGFSRRTFYKLFKNKEAALLALFQEGARLLVAAVRRAVSEAKSPADKVIAAVDTYLEFLELGGRAWIALQAESIRPDSLLAAQREQVFDAFVALLGANVHPRLGYQVDPYVYRCLLLGMEGLIIDAERRSEFSLGEKQRVRGAFLPILLRSLAPDGVTLARLPVV